MAPPHISSGYANEANTPSIGYRPDIDGLRALAVLPILAFHLDLEFVPGGFAGVDIFFVISGYLITRILVREMDAGRLSLARFYVRRAARVLPALALVLAAALAWACFCLLPFEQRVLGRSAAATALFVSNLYFWRFGSYFSQNAETLPLLHTWSLGIEEQFYILYPLLLVFLRRWMPSRERLILIATVLLSFALCWGWSDANGAFYSLPTRAWELGLGALVARGTVPVIKSASIRQGLAALGLLMILASFALLSADRLFPAPAALLPCGGTALLIAYGEGATTGRFLRWGALRAIGLRSYSLYLWHWPLIVFYKIDHGMRLRPLDVLLLLATTFIAAEISYRFVERPVRARTGGAPPIKALGLAGAATAVIVAASLIVSVNIVRGWRLDPREARIASYLEYPYGAARKQQFRSPTCFAETAGPGRIDLPICLAPASGKANILLLGDSHAAALSNALRDRFPEINLMQVTASGCRAFLTGKIEKRCALVIHDGFAAAWASGKVQGVVLAGRWKERELPQLSATLDLLRQRRIPVLLIGPGAEYLAPLPSLILHAYRSGDGGVIARSRDTTPAMLDRRMAALAAQAGIAYYSLYQHECPDARCVVLFSSGDPAHFDQTHLTPAGARFALRELQAIPAR